MSAIANNIKEKYIILLKYEGIKYEVHPVAQKRIAAPQVMKFISAT